MGKPRGFTALESLVMLVILSVLTMIFVGIGRKMLRSEDLAPEPPTLESLQSDLDEEDESTEVQDVVPEAETVNGSS